MWVCPCKQLNEWIKKRWCGGSFTKPTNSPSPNTSTKGKEKLPLTHMNVILIFSLYASVMYQQYDTSTHAYGETLICITSVHTIVSTTQQIDIVIVRRIQWIAIYSILEYFLWFDISRYHRLMSNTITPFTSTTQKPLNGAYSINNATSHTHTHTQTD